jgi:hypothetical protein
VGTKFSYMGGIDSGALLHFQVTIVNSFALGITKELEERI